MDFSFHIQQGQQLLERNDVASIKRALNHFKEANQITENDSIVKPKSLYFLALGNYRIGQIVKAYKIAHKAKKSIDTAILNSPISMDNIREFLGEEDINTLIHHIENSHRDVVINASLDDSNLNENEIDFSLLDRNSVSSSKKDVVPEFSIDNLNKEVVIATFFGMGRNDDELIYFDKLKGDVLCYVQGYFSSQVGDQTIANRKLADKISNHEPHDYLDEERYILLDRLPLSEFLKEFKKQAEDNETFLSYANYFDKKILEDFKFAGFVSTDQIVNNPEIQKKFHKLFVENHQNQVEELKEDYTNIWQKASNNLAINWIETNIFGNGDRVITDSQLEKMSSKEIFTLRRECAQRHDIESLSTIAEYLFKSGSAATNKSNLPELCYYYGRLKKVDELKEFINQNSFFIQMLPEYSKELAQNLFNIGLKFPHLNDKEVDYLEQKYSEPQTFELFDVIMFDEELLPRRIMKFDKELLKNKNLEFTKDFLLELFSCFIANEEQDNEFSEFLAYSRIENKIIQKKYHDIGLGEYLITQPIHTDKLYNLLIDMYGLDCGDYFMKQIANDDDISQYINSDFYVVDARTIVGISKEYFNIVATRQSLQTEIALLWLKKINTLTIELT